MATRRAGVPPAVAWGGPVLKMRCGLRSLALLAVGVAFAVTAGISHAIPQSPRLRPPPGGSGGFNVAGGGSVGGTPTPRRIFVHILPPPPPPGG